MVPGFRCRGIESSASTGLTVSRDEIVTCSGVGTGTVTVMTPSFVGLSRYLETTPLSLVARPPDRSPFHRTLAKLYVCNRFSQLGSQEKVKLISPGHTLKGHNMRSPKLMPNPDQQLFLCEIVIPALPVAIPSSSANSSYSHHSHCSLGGFYKRGCQEKIVLPRRRSRYSSLTSSPSGDA